MTFLFDDSKRTQPIVRLARASSAPLWADLAAFLLLAAIAALVLHGAEQMGGPLSAPQTEQITLALADLPDYALRTTLRMFAALGGSLVFTLTVATLAARSRKAEMVIIPALDILQSVPVLGFLTFTITFFMGLFPGKQLGVECAAIFAIFTSQAWNMAFSFHQSLRTVPGDIDEVCRQFGFSSWRRFVRLELPFAAPGLIWNMMMSMSGSWFFVVASEAITVGDKTVMLPGVGSWLALAIARQDITAVAWAVAAMAVVILLYDQLFFRPIVAWADKFRLEQTGSQERPRSWFYNLVQRTRLTRRALAWPGHFLAAIDWPVHRLPPHRRLGARGTHILDAAWFGLIAFASIAGIAVLARFIAATLTAADIVSAFALGLATMLRVIVLVALASLIWVPVGVFIGLRPAWAGRVQPIAQFLAAFPANVLFPFAVTAILGLHLNPDIWLSPLMVLGTQWYILFNVIAGASALPTDLREAATMFDMRGWQWWRRLALPDIFPYYVTGALTASGGSWNASIVAEAVSWGGRHVEAAGLGSYIARATAAGDIPRVALGIAVMSIFVIALNRILWRPLYGFAERRLRLN